MRPFNGARLACVGAAGEAAHSESSSTLPRECLGRVSTVVPQPITITKRCLPKSDGYQRRVMP
jgi:hypothetical protein